MTKFPTPKRKRAATKEMQVIAAPALAVATPKGKLGDLILNTYKVAGDRVTVETLDKLKDKLGSAIVMLASAEGADKVTLIAGVTADLAGKVKAGDLVGHVASQVGGKGGGKADMAMAGGTDASKVPAALASVQAWVAERV